MTTEEAQGKRCSGRRWLWRMPFIVLAIVLIKGAVVMALWNALVPELFHGPVLSYVQAIGITVLAKLLVGWGPHGGHGRFGPPWRRFGGLSPEERLKLRQEWRGRCTESQVN